MYLNSEQVLLYMRAFFILLFFYCYYYFLWYSSLVVLEEGADMLGTFRFSILGFLLPSITLSLLLKEKTMYVNSIFFSKIGVFFLKKSHKN
jgi:hypothetical protein